MLLYPVKRALDGHVIGFCGIRSTVRRCLFFSLLVLLLPVILKKLSCNPHTFPSLAVCYDVIRPPDRCRRFITARRTEDAGFGHQVMEMLFAMEVGRREGFSFVYKPLVASGKHGHSYRRIDTDLGIAKLFSLLRTPGWPQIARDPALAHAVLGRNGDIKRFVGNCNVLVELDGYGHCGGDCFKAGSNEYLFQRFAPCLQEAVRQFGNIFDECIFGHLGISAPFPYIVAFHLRFGDFVAHDHHDSNYVIKTLTYLRALTGGHYVLIVLVGGGNGTTAHSLHQFAQAVTSAAHSMKGGSTFSVLVPSLDFDDSMRVMMQADMLIGSGSSLPQVAALLSEMPLFFNHEAKHGFHFGAELLGSHVDVDRSGMVIDSLRRVRVELFRRRHLSLPWDPCRKDRVVWD